MRMLRLLQTENRSQFRVLRGKVILSTQADMLTTEIVGATLNKLTAMHLLPLLHNGRKMLVCRCECGRIAITRINKFISGHTKSCGCLHIKHGMKGSREFRSWVSMKTRCYNAKHDSYKYYGGRGISVCSRWLNSFKDFYADMGPRPDGHTLDRIDTNGNYEPSNCRWSDHSTQMKNRRRRIKTHCAMGHCMDIDNTLVSKGGRRRCRTCIRDYNRKYSLGRRAA